MTCRLALFGSPRLVDLGGATVQFPKKGLFLIAYLLLSDRAFVMTRVRAANLLWDEAEDKSHSAGNLRQLLARIRSRQAELGIELLSFEGVHIRLNPSSIEVDVTRFQRMIASPDPVNVKDLNRLYTSDFMSDMDTLGEEAESWMQIHRSRLRGLFVETLAKSIESSENRDERNTIALAAQRLLTIDPYHEAAYRALMRIAVAGRQFTRVRELYDTCKNLLRNDLGITPSPETDAFMRDVLPAHRGALEIKAPAASAPPRPGENRSPAPSAGMPRVTILPPFAGTGENTHRALAGSMLEDVTIGLCALRTFSLIAPHTAWQIQREGVPSGLLDRYSIDYVVESNLVSHGSLSTLFVKLLRARGRDIVWAERFEFEALSAASQHREIARRIGSSLIDRIEQRELERYEVEQHPTAYQHYLMGRLHLASMDLPSVRRARKIFRTALNACPEFVPALSGLARTYQREWLLLARGDQEMLRQAEIYATKATSLSPDDARGYRELGVCSLFSGRFDDSIDALRQAEATSPQYADVIADFADTLVHSSEPELGLEKIEKAIKLNPLCPDYYWWTAAGANYHLERYDAALSCLSEMKDQSPAYRLAAMTWGMKGNRTRARAFMHKAKAIHPDFKTQEWLSVLPFREKWQLRHYELGLRAAGFD